MDRRAIPLMMLAVSIAFCGCQQLRTNRVIDRLVASNARDWSPQFSKLPYATGQADGSIQIKNIRNNQYVTEGDFLPQYYDRKIQLTDIQSVDFIVCPFQEHEYMAHTMLSFGLSDGTFIAVSSEIRTEKGEEYSPFWGLNHQYELTYVVADEKDVIRLRTHHRDADVYIYRTVSTVQQSQALFVDMMERTNQLAKQPEFYDTIRNNCTTNILNHVNRLKKQKLLYNWKIFLPGYSAEYAYEEGLLDQSVSYSQLTHQSWVNDLSNQYYEAEDYSQKIRQRLRVPKPAAASPSTQQQANQPVRTALRNIRGNVSNWFIQPAANR